MCVTFRFILPACALVKATLRWVGTLVPSDGRACCTLFIQWVFVIFQGHRQTNSASPPHFFFPCLKPLLVLLSLEDRNFIYFFLEKKSPTFKMSCCFNLYGPTNVLLIYRSCWSQFILENYISFHIFSTIQIAGRHVLLPGGRLINSKFLDSWVFDLGLPAVFFAFSGDKVGLRTKIHLRILWKCSISSSGAAAASSPAAATCLVCSN